MHRNPDLLSPLTLSLLTGPHSTPTSQNLTAVLGTDIDAGGEVAVDFRPLDAGGDGHSMFVSGPTGCGKSVVVATALVSLAAALTPDQVQFHINDPDVADYLGGDRLPHIVGVHDAAASILTAATDALAARESQFTAADVDDVTGFREAGGEMPDLFFVISGDFLTDEEWCRVGDMSRIVRTRGMHLIVVVQKAVERHRSLLANMGIRVTAEQRGVVEWSTHTDRSGRLAVCDIFRPYVKPAEGETYDEALSRADKSVHDTLPTQIEVLVDELAARG